MIKKKNNFSLSKAALICGVCLAVLSSNYYCTSPNCPSKEPDLPIEQGDLGPQTSQNPYVSRVLAGDTGVSGTTTTALELK